MKFTKHLTSVLISFTCLFCTNPAFSQQGNIVKPPIREQITCKISPKKIIYMDGRKPVKIDGVEDQLYFYYAAGNKPEGQLNTVTTKKSPPFSYLFHEIQTINIKNSHLLAIPNIDSRKVYHFVTVRLKNRKPFDSYLKVNPGRGFYYQSNSGLLKTFNLADCKTIIFEGIKDPSKI